MAARSASPFCGRLVRSRAIPKSIGCPLATRFPQAGGFYVYKRAVFGGADGFTAGWVDWLTQCSALAYLGVSMAEFAAALLQWRGTLASGRAQEIASAIQACGFTLFLPACFVLAPDSSGATLLCLLSLPPAFNSALLVATRISFAMSRDGLFWVDANGVDPLGTPASNCSPGSRC